MKCRAKTRRLLPSQGCCLSVAASSFEGRVTRYLECWRLVEEHQNDTKQLEAFSGIIDMKCEKIRAAQGANAFNIAEAIKETVQILHKCRGFLQNFEMALFYFEPGSVDEDLFRGYVVSIKQVVMRLSEILQMDSGDIKLPDILDHMAVARSVFDKFA